MLFAKWLFTCLPTTLRGKMLLLSLVVVVAPIVSAGYLLEREGRHALLQEKQKRLFGLTRILDAQLGDKFDALLADASGNVFDRAAALARVNAVLSPITDQIAEANPGIGVGYYSKALNAIVTYGPSQQYASKVGLPLPPDHPGWKVLESGENILQAGPQVRGFILNAMLPILRGGVVVGYIWANELADDIERQATAMDHAILAVSAAGILVGLLLTQVLFRHLSQDIKGVTMGLARMRTDLGRMIQPPAGEIGEIAVEVNGMARALLDARSLTENILNSITDGVIAVDRLARVTAINPAAQRMIGVTAAEVIGRPYRSLFDEQTGVSAMLFDTLETGTQHIGVALDFPPPMRMRHVNVSSSLLRDSHGAAIGAVVVLNDLTEQRRLQTQILRADRLAALGELMAGMAHEIRNPLTSIRGFMQFLETCDDIGEWRRYAPLIVRQVDSLNRIVTELLEFGRPRPPTIQPVQVNDLIREVLLLTGSMSNIQLVLDLSADLPLIEADGEALKQVVLNLLINATQAITGMGTGTGTIRIATMMASMLDGDREAVVTVTDDGVGIAPESVAKVFDPFFSTKANGTGLGLAMVHRIVDAHHGTIGLTSAPGSGTVVTLRLPVTHNALGHNAAALS